jgi:hypothetical protein
MLHHKTTPKTNIYYTMADAYAYAYEEAYAYTEEDLITCDYCGNRWDGCAQCNCWGYLNSAQENAETSEAASEAASSEALKAASSNEAASEADTSKAATSETASEATNQIKL